MTIVSPFLTFPNISWWAQVKDAGLVILDGGEHFQKMTSRNRYHISGANNPILLSVPLVNGRNQHVPMKDVNIYNGDRWQVQHWRTLVSVYRRTPYFDHYEEGLAQLFHTEYTHLIDFNRAGLEWAKEQLKMTFDTQETMTFQKEYPGDITDLRSGYRNVDRDQPRYYQVFEDRIGFRPDLSILDLLFSEGPRSIELLRG